MADRIMELKEGTKFQLLAPIVRGRKGRHEKIFSNAKRSGYVRVRVDGNIYDLEEEINWTKIKSTALRSLWTGWQCARGLKRD